jgi:hypothetical protein
LTLLEELGSGQFGVVKRGKWKGKKRLLYFSLFYLFYHWYFVLKKFLTYCEKKNIEKLLKFEVEGQEFANILRSLKQFIQKVKGQNSF